MIIQDHWKEHYWQHLLNEEIEQFVELKSLHFPNSLFKYKALSSFCIDAIETDRIWLAEIETLNDPFECSLIFDIDEGFRVFYGSDAFRRTFEDHYNIKLENQEITRLVNSKHPLLEFRKICLSKNIRFANPPEEEIVKIQARMDQIVAQANKSLRVTCFSENKDSILMWSHYADQHKGICIEYNMVDLPMIRPFLQPVIYRNAVFNLPILDRLNQYSLIAASLVKCKTWEYEAEWRYTAFGAINNSSTYCQLEKPIAIYLGTRFDTNDDKLKKDFYSLVQKRNIPIYRMAKHKKEYRLSPE